MNHCDISALDDRGSKQAASRPELTLIQGGRADQDSDTGLEVWESLGSTLQAAERDRQLGQWLLGFDLELDLSLVLEEVVVSLDERCSLLEREHVVMTQLLELIQIVRDTEMNGAMESVFLQLCERCVSIRHRQDTISLYECEWTTQVFIADALLRRGCCLFESSIQKVVEALWTTDNKALDEALDEVEEALFHFSAVSEWKKQPWV